VDSSIYNMALFTLIDPTVIEEWQKDVVEKSDGKTDIVTPVKLNE